MTDNDLKWHRRFLRLAETIASWSKDPSTQVGSVIARPDRSTCSLGYNGFPRRMMDRPEFYEDRPTKYSRVVHAEMNALLASRESVLGYTCYTWPFPPCDRCAVMLIQAGVSRVVCPRGEGEVARQREQRSNVHLAREWFTEAQMELIEIEYPTTPNGDPCYDHRD